MSAHLYAVRFDDGEVKYGFSDGYTLSPQLFATTQQAWAAYPGKSGYTAPREQDATGEGERVQLAATGSALHAQWATATRTQLTSGLNQEDFEAGEESLVHPFAVRFGAQKSSVHNWAVTD